MGVKMTLNFEMQWLPTLPREGDTMLMDLPALNLNLAHVVLRELNQCRFYLQVLSLLDIVSADGLMLLLEAIQGNPIPYRMSSLEWLFQQRPSACSLPSIF
jgi:hypothetical protein